MSDPTPTLGISRMSFWFGWGTAGALVEFLRGGDMYLVVVVALFATMQLSMYRQLKRILMEKESERKRQSESNN